jgi:hypothetical protein
MGLPLPGQNIPVSYRIWNTGRAANRLSLAFLVNAARVCFTRFRLFLHRI